MIDRIVDLIIRYPDRLHEVRRNLKLVEAIGMPGAGEDLEFPLTLDDFTELSGLPEAARLPDAPYVCLHPGARNPAKHDGGRKG